MKYIVYPYNMASMSAKKLANALHTKRVWPNRNYTYLPHHLIIGWGNSTVPNWDVPTSNYLNHPNCIKDVIDKRTFFNEMRGYIRTVENTVDKHQAINWNCDVIARHSLNGHSGKGIELVEKGMEMVDAPLYTKYIDKRHEYRVHVFDKEVIDVTKKRRRDGVQPGGIVRNVSNGWVYCRNNVSAPSSVLEEASKAIALSKLCFGAVDVIYNLDDELPYVLEINSAPGLEGTTLNRYVAAFNSYLNSGE